MCLSFRTRVDVESRVRVNGQQSNQIPRDGRTILLATFATKGGAIRRAPWRQRQCGGSQLAIVPQQHRECAHLSQPSLVV